MNIWIKIKEHNIIAERRERRDLGINANLIEESFGRVCVCVCVYNLIKIVEQTLISRRNPIQL